MMDKTYTVKITSQAEDQIPKPARSIITPVSKYMQLQKNAACTAEGTKCNRKL